MKTILFTQNEDWLNSILNLIEACSKESINTNGIFNFLLTGGDTPRFLYQKLSLLNTNWENWNFWITDERFYNYLDIKYNYNCEMIFTEFLNKISITKKQIHFIDKSKCYDDAVNFYKNELLQLDLFDFAILGIGEDGHTASLFPGNDIGELSTSDDVLTINNSPKAPSQRISLSVNRLNKSKNILFMANGESKNEIINQIINKRQFPCTLIKGKIQTFLYYLL
jgi:6-phosphogluconolactonase